MEEYLSQKSISRKRKKKLLFEKLPQITTVDGQETSCFLQPILLNVLLDHVYVTIFHSWEMSKLS